MELEGVFTSEQLMRLTGITRQRLAYWLDTNVIAADVDRAKGRGRIRLFSFSNLVEVRVALWLRDKVPLQLIREIVARLRERDGALHPLAEVSFGVIEGAKKSRDRVIVKGADGVWENWSSGQKVMEITIPLKYFSDDLHSKAVADRRRQRRAGKVEKRRGALGSVPLIAGTRVPVRSIQSLTDAGWDIDRILDNYPGLKRSDIRIALRTTAKRSTPGSKSA